MSQLDKELGNLQPTRRITGVQFGIMSPDLIRNGSVCEVEKPDTYEGTEPVINGLFDPRMGVIERGPVCATCENDTVLCPGHFGHIELALPVFYLHFLPTVAKLLPCICFRCSTLLVRKNTKKLLRSLQGKRGEQRFQLIYEASTKSQKSSRCCQNVGCAVVQPAKYMIVTAEKARGQDRDNVATIIAEFKQEALRDTSVSVKHRITPEHCYEIFRKITDDDSAFLGFHPKYARPEWLICTVLPVPPPAVRPSVQRENNQRAEDDLTYVLHMIVKANNLLKKRLLKGEDQKKVDGAYNFLQYNVATLISNKMPGIPKNVQRSGKVIKSLIQRITGKEARIRGNLMGKRVDFSARTVISVNPEISIEEYGVPKKIAMNLTYPEVVTPYNIEDMNMLVRNGPNIHPGAKRVERMEYDCFGTPAPCTISLKHVDPNSIVLKPGDVVHRHLQDGDIGLFNRQPSLHRMNMMAHKVRVMENNTFRLNVFVCLAGDTVINTPMGSTTLAELEKNWQNSSISSCHWQKNKAIYECDIEHFHRIVPSDLGFKSYEITLENGVTIKATQEHPFYTKRGDRVEAKDLVVGDYLVVYNEEMPPIDQDSGEVILTTEQISAILPPKTLSGYTLKSLQKLGLHEIQPSDRKQILLAGLLGHLFGDGTLWWDNKNVHLTFRASTEPDIKAIQSDLLKLGIEAKVRKHPGSKNRKIKTSDGKEYCFDSDGLYEIDLRSRPLAMAFHSLGIPAGDRVKQEFRIPSWIRNGSKMVKRQFVRGYFGADASKPAVDKRTGYRFKTINFKMFKIEGKSAEGFFTDIYDILHEFEIQTLPIRSEKGNIRKSGLSSSGYVGGLCSDVANLKTFCQKIGYLYCQERQSAAMIISGYCEHLIQQPPYKYGRNGYLGVDTFEEWSKKHCMDGADLLWYKIQKIKEIQLDEAFDLTTADSNHNFISSRVLSKNCTPYNADFDGDEMNTHIPQSLHTRIQLQRIAAVPTQIISPAKSAPIIKVAQDSMVGSYLLSQETLAATGESVFHYLMPLVRLKGDFSLEEARKHRLWSGVELFSTILPSISYEGETDNGHVIFRNGVFEEGILDKGILGGRPGGLIQSIFNQFGPWVCRDFLDNLQRLVVGWLETHGFTIGFGDGMPTQEVKDTIAKTLEEHTHQVEELIAKAHQGVYEPELSNKLRMKKFEQDIQNVLAEANKEVGSTVMENLSPGNNFMVSVKSGSKGSKINMNQIMGTVGQQIVDATRVPFGFNGRTLPHFHKQDYGPKSRGFCYSTYMDGLQPHEFFFAAMGARTGSINSHIKTSETGYIQRRMIKAMEDLQVRYDDTVRDAANNIVQFYYGGDSFDPVKVEWQKLRTLEFNNQEMKQHYHWTVDDILPSMVTEETLQTLKKKKVEIDKVLQGEWEQLNEDREVLRSVYFPHLESADAGALLPVNFKQLFTAMRFQFNIRRGDLSDLTPDYVVDKIGELTKYVVKYLHDKRLLGLYKIHIRSSLSSKQCIKKHRLPKAVFDQMLEQIRIKTIKAFVDAGEMVGILSAQSIGEPLTQMTLNTFHFAGVGSKAVLTNTGVPRINEIINLSKDIKTPSMSIYLKPQYAENRDLALKVKNELEFTEIRDILLQSDILYLPDVEKGKYPEDVEVYQTYEEMSKLMEMECPEPETLTNWMLWMEFDREGMVQRDIYMQDIHEVIAANCNVETDIQCIFSDMNSGHLTLRIRARQDFEEGDHYISFFREIGDCILGLSLRGIEGIRKVGCEQKHKVVYDPDGSARLVQEWVLNTDGSNLIEVLSNDYVDSARTTTNDICETLNVFGIEAARSAIIREMEATITSSGGGSVAYRHYSVLADTMTYRGSTMSITRHGFGKSPYIGPLGRSTFEVMDRILVTAGIFAEHDNMNGTSANIIVGQAVPSGTNSFKLYMNTALLPPPSHDDTQTCP